MHGASVGEGLSLVPLATSLLARRPEATVLVTTGTRTSARVLAKRLPAGAVHQFAPLDTPDAVARFLGHWRPDLAVFAESELWPNLILGAQASGVRMALVSARMSESSFRNWRRFPRAARALLGAFHTVLPRDEASAALFRTLGANPDGLVDLKAGAPTLPVDDVELATLSGKIGQRPVILAASTHPGEEALVLQRFSAFGRHDSRPLLILAPRHPERGEQVEALARASGWTVARRASGQGPDNAEVYIADTLGDLGLWYRLSAIAVIGGSFVSGVGGHNPLEPARLGCPFVSGVHVENWPVYSALQSAGATHCVTADGLDDYMHKAVVAHPSLATMSRRAEAFVKAQDRENQNMTARLTAMLPA